MWTLANFKARQGGRGIFSCNFTCMDKAQQFRPARLTPKPIVQGPQTAMIVGPKGEEIYTDKYGRVKVMFHWDRYSKADENSSCWIRVSSESAGKKWGSIHLPRIGQEVIVEFLEGDPDQPIITGRVYNGDAMPPYDLPAERPSPPANPILAKVAMDLMKFVSRTKKGRSRFSYMASMTWMSACVIMSRKPITATVTNGSDGRPTAGAGVAFRLGSRG